MASRAFTVECADHGTMPRDEPLAGYFCMACGRFLPYEEVFRLVTAAPAESGDPVPLVVT